MTETKPWWLSRTVWVGLATAILATLSAAGLLPPGFEQTIIEELIVGILGILAIIFRVQAKKEIETSIV